MASNENDNQQNRSNNARSFQDDPIGKTSSPFREPNTTDVFCFWLRGDVRLNPFDFVVAEQSDGSQTVGIIDEIFAHTDSESHLTNYIGDELGNPRAEPYVDRVSAMVARAHVLRNIRNDDLQELYMPVPTEKRVFFADENAISGALGFDQIRGDRIPGGLIKQSNGTMIPVYLDSHYVVGPEAAHANASGISGLATKTSYLMFLAYAAFRSLSNVSMIVFNVKHSDLLHVHEQANDLTAEDREAYDRLGLEVRPFEHVTYYLPRGSGGRPDSDEPPEDYRLYAYALQDVYRDLDLLFADVIDPYNTLQSFTTYVRDHWESDRVVFEGEARGGRTHSATVRSWDDLRNADDNAVGVCVYGAPAHPTPPRLRRELRRLTSHSIFVNHRTPDEVSLGETVRQNIRPGQISVIDIYRIPTVSQPLIIGNVMRSIESLYREQELAGLPNLIIFIDELNTFAPARETPNAVTEQIIDIAIKGRGRRTALFGAQQFKSEVHRLVWGNCTINAVGRTGGAELRTAAYGEIDERGKNSVMNLRQGEMLLSFRNWRYPVKVAFPRPPYRRPSR